jgi:hypothetical protein
METTGWDLAATIRALSQIGSEERLPEMQRDVSLQCRGLPSDRSRLHLAKWLLHVKEVSRALAALFDLPLEESEAAVRSVLLPHPRREIALATIGEYLGRQVDADEVPAAPQDITRDDTPRVPLPGSIVGLLPLAAAPDSASNVSIQ